MSKKKKGPMTHVEFAESRKNEPKTLRRLLSGLLGGDSEQFDEVDGDTEITHEFAYELAMLLFVGWEYSALLPGGMLLARYHEGGGGDRVFLDFKHAVVLGC